MSIDETFRHHYCNTASTTLADSFGSYEQFLFLLSTNAVSRKTQFERLSVIGVYKRAIECGQVTKIRPS